MVAYFEAGDCGTYGGDDAGGVGAGDAGEGHLGVVGAEDDHEVAVVEAGGVEVDEDFGGAGVGEGEGVEREIVETKGVEAKGGGGHAVLLESWMGLIGMRCALGGGRCSDSAAERRR